jgi:hypothetical protein
LATIALIAPAIWPRASRRAATSDGRNALSSECLSAAFPPPWSAEETEACYIVRDANGQALAYVYYEQEPGRRATAHLLTRDEVWRIAVNIAKLPELLQRG